MLPKVLFVDDDTHVLDSILRIMKKEPFYSVIADSPTAALDELEQHANEFHVVVTDQQMPWMEGDTLVSRIRSKYPHIICIILTGHASIDSAMKGINRGEIYRYLTKPINAADLKLAINEALIYQKTVSSMRPIADKLNLDANIEHQLDDDLSGDIIVSDNE